MNSRVLSSIFLLFSYFSFSQDPGISYQAIIYDLDGKSLPGKDDFMLPLADTQICLRFTILDAYEIVEYQEVVRTETDVFGMVNLVIGVHGQTSGYALDFSSITWGTDHKYLEVALDSSGGCNSFEQISYDTFNYVPLAFSALSTERINGVVPISNGGTGGTTLEQAKQQLELDQVDNTKDVDKPISREVENALRQKENISNKSIDFTSDADSDQKYPSVKSVKNYIDARVSDVQFESYDLDIKLDSLGMVLSQTDDLKENTANKSTDTTLSDATDIMFPTVLAVKTYVDNEVEKATSGSDYVDLSSDQTIAGLKFFDSDIRVNLLTIGKGAGNVLSNTVMGSQALGLNSTGFHNTGIGNFALFSNTSGSRNTGIGSNALYSNTEAHDNTALGYRVLEGNTAGGHNSGFGSESLWKNTTGQNNTAIGAQSLWSNVDGSDNTAIGRHAMFLNTSGRSNTATGSSSLRSNTTGIYNVAYGVQAMEANTTGSQNTAVGVGTMDFNTSGSNNTIMGAFAGRYIADGVVNTSVIQNSVLLGAETKPKTNDGANEIVIGYQAIGNGSNTIQLGNKAITNVNTSGTLTAGAVTYTNTDGINGQVLMTDGSGNTKWGTIVLPPPLLVREVADEYTAAAGQTSFTLTGTPSPLSRVKMFVNGVRISNSAYSISGSELTYIPTNNGGYQLSANDRVQFDFYY